MKLKYYLRGLGIGIIVTAVIMGVTSASRQETLSDREIMERAAELGMSTQSGSLAEMAQEETAEPLETQKPEETPKATATKEPEETPKATAAKEPEETPKATAVKEPEETPKTVIIEIKSGDGSYTVCQKLEQIGLITSASDFDTYLYSNGYDRKLRAGSHEIPADAKPEEIAKILCGM